MIIETHRGYEVTGIRLFNDNNYRSISLAERQVLMARSWESYKETIILHSMFRDLVSEEKMIRKIFGSGYNVSGINLIDVNNQYRRIVTLADQVIIVEASWAEMCETVIIHSFAFEVLNADTL